MAFCIKMIHAPICIFSLSPLHSQLLYSNSYCVVWIFFFRLSISTYLQQRVNRRLKLFAFPLNVPKAVTIRCTWTALYIIRRLKYTTAKRAFLKFFFFPVLKGSCQLIANSKYAIVERQSLFCTRPQVCFNPLRNFPAKQTTVCACCSSCLSGNPTPRFSRCSPPATSERIFASRAALVNPLCLSPPPSSTPSRSLQRPRGAALPGKRPHAHVCQVSLHLPATSRCRAGVQSCTEGHAVSFQPLSSRTRKKVFVVMVCQLFVQ